MQKYSEHTGEKIEVFFKLDTIFFALFQVPNEEELKKLAEVLSSNNISHKVWIEHPENIATCIAVKPYPKGDIQKYLKKYKLFNVG